MKSNTPKLSVKNMNVLLDALNIIGNWTDFAEETPDIDEYMLESAQTMEVSLGEFIRCYENQAQRRK